MLKNTSRPAAKTRSTAPIARMAASRAFSPNHQRANPRIAQPSEIQTAWAWMGIAVATNPIATATLVSTSRPSPPAHRKAIQAKVV